MDKKKVCYVTRGSNKRKASNNKTQVLKKKGSYWGRNPKSVDVQVARKRKASEEPINHEQEDLPKGEDVLTLINTSIINTSVTSSFGSNVAALDGDDNKRVGEELRCVDLLVVPLSPYRFVHQVQDPIEKLVTD